MNPRAMLADLVGKLQGAGYQPAAVFDYMGYTLASDVDELLGVTRYEQSTEPRTIVRALTIDEILVALEHGGALHFTHQGKRTWGERSLLVRLDLARPVVGWSVTTQFGEPWRDLIEFDSDILS